MSKTHRLPCVHGEHGDCVKCKRIEDQFSATFDERRLLKATPSSNAQEIEP